ncbi:LysR family transcriptional regulator [Pseudokordiimonas caeni]|uniref:LysR family transcriptional regulator n=1 Tax=Pseudokordiimonas caeni TaxID=2997908 RepID=UPI00281253E7|nr:LysR family transcriptional regulator [Pseudokordiimonas caeni]
MSMINLRHLRAFEAVMQNRHFTKAAESIGLSQPALSALIHQLEEDLGVKLFNRSTRNVEPTAIGLEFGDVIKRLLGQFDEALANVTKYSDLTRGKVSIGVLPSLASTILPETIARFRSQYPDITIEVSDVLGTEIVDLLLNKQIDFAVSRTQKHREIDALPLLNDRLVLVGTPQTIRPAGNQIKWHELAEEPIIAMAPGSTIRALTDGATSTAGFTPNIVMEPRLIPTAIAFARAGLGCAILPCSESPTVKLTDLPQFDLVEPYVRREISLMRLAGAAASPAAAALSRHLQQDLKKMAGGTS